MESKMEKFMDVMSIKISQLDEAQKRMEQMIRNHSSSIHNLEVQIGQLANSLSTRNQGALPRNTKKNTKEQVKAITLISGTKIQTPKATMEYDEKKKEGKKEPESERVETLKEPKVKVENKEKAKAPLIRPYEPPVPYPRRLMKKEYDQ